MMKSMMKYVATRGEALFDRSKPDAVNFLRYIVAKHEEAEAEFRRRHQSHSHDKWSVALAQYKDITKKLGRACTAQEIAKLEQEASQAWSGTRGHKKLQEVTIGSCTLVDLLNDTVDSYKLRRIVKG